MTALTEKRTQTHREPMSSPKPLFIELDFDTPEDPMIMYEDFEDEEDEDYMTMIEDETA